MDVIIYFHGFNSDGNGTTARELKSHYGDMCITPSYDYKDADKAYSYLNGIITRFIKHGQIILVGTSLGGFWANYFSEKYDLKCILVNPGFEPSISLKKFLGKNKNFSSGKIIDFTEEDVERYKRYEVGESSEVFKTVLLGAKDTTLNHTRAAEHFKNHNVIIDQDEEHRIKDVGKIIKLIDELMNSFAEQVPDDQTPLNEHVVNAPPKDIQTKIKYADQVWDMLQSSYKKIGGLKGNGFSSKEEMIESIPFWKMVRKNGKIIAVRMYKDKFGRKSVAGGTDGSREGLEAFRMLSDDDLDQNRAFAEVSGPVLAFIVKNNQNIKSKCIPYAKVEKMFAEQNEDIRRPQSNDPEMLKHPELKDFFYQRFIGSSYHTKLMIGTVGVKMY